MSTSYCSLQRSVPRCKKQYPASKTASWCTGRTCGRTSETSTRRAMAPCTRTTSDRSLRTTMWICLKRSFITWLQSLTLWWRASNIKTLLRHTWNRVNVWLQFIILQWRDVIVMSIQNTYNSTVCSTAFHANNKENTKVTALYWFFSEGITT